MPTSKERILVTLTPSMSRELNARAKREKTPRATIARFLLEQALDELTDEEDRYLSALSDKRLKETKRWLTADEFWSEVEKRRAKRTRAKK